jgi:type IV secretory pathway protease TraF
VKVIAAMPGDHVEVSPQGVRVNSVALPGDAAVSRDSRGREGREYSFGSFQTPSKYVWLFGLKDREAGTHATPDRRHSDLREEH